MNRHQQNINEGINNQQEPDKKFMLNIHYKKLRLPDTLKHFVKMQKVYHEEKRLRLLVHWREYLHTEIQSKLKETNKPKEEQIFKFFSADVKDYEGGYLQRFLHKIDFIFNTQLRETVVKNMIE